MYHTYYKCSSRASLRVSLAIRFFPRLSYSRAANRYVPADSADLMKTWVLRNKMDAPVSVCLSRGKAAKARRVAVGS